MEHQESLLYAFRLAVETGDTSRLTAMLSQDVELGVDGGGKVPAHPKMMVGKSEVLDFIATKLRRFWQNCHWIPTVVNGIRGALIYDESKVIALVGFSWNAEHSPDRILIVKNPEKLTRFEKLPWNVQLR